MGGPLLGYLRRFTELALPQGLRESKCSLADEVGKGISSDRIVRAKHGDVARIMSGWGGGWSTLQSVFGYLVCFSWVSFVFVLFHFRHHINFWFTESPRL